MPIDIAKFKFIDCKKRILVHLVELFTSNHLQELKCVYTAIG